MFKFLKEKIKGLLKKKEKEIEVEKVEEKVEEKEKKIEEKEKKKEKSLFSFSFGKIKIDEKQFYNFFDEFKIILWQSNVACEVVDFLEEKLKQELIGKEINKKEFEGFFKAKVKRSYRKFICRPY